MPKPVVQAMVLADHVYRDAATGKFIIAGTFSTLKRVLHQQNPAQIASEETPDAGRPSEIEGQRHVISGPITRAGSPYLYVALSDVHGRVPLRLRFMNLSDAQVLMEADLEVSCSDPIAVAEYPFELPMLPGGPGNYSLDLLYEGEIIGSWPVIIKLDAE